MIVPKVPPGESPAMKRFKKRYGSKKKPTTMSVRNALNRGSLPARMQDLREMGFANIPQARKWLKENEK